MKTRFVSFLIALIGGGFVPVAFAQTKDFPARPVRVVVPVPPGGSLDVMSRIFSPKWGEVMGQNVIAATPAPLDTIARALRDPGLAERFDREGAVIVAGSPADLAAHVRAELALY